MAELSNGTVSVVLGEGDITLEDIKYEPFKINNSVRAGQRMSDAICTGKRDEPMRVTIEGYIKGDIITNKVLLSGLCVPNSPMLLKDNDGYSLELFASTGLELSNETHLRDKLLKYKINAIAPSPIWRGDELSQLFRSCANVSTDTNAINITNIGELPVGCIIKVHAMTICDSVMLRIGDKRFQYEQPLGSFDTLFIDTRYGKKSVTLQKRDETAVESVIEYVSPSSEFFELPVGDTRIDFNILNGLAYITIYYTPMYLR